MKTWEQLAKENGWRDTAADPRPDDNAREFPCDTLRHDDLGRDWPDHDWEGACRDLGLDEGDLMGDSALNTAEANLASGFEIRFVILRDPDASIVTPERATHLALYKRGADGLAEWVADYELTTSGVERLSARVYSLTIGALQGLGLGDKIAGAKP